MRNVSMGRAFTLIEVLMVISRE
ncbi:MAG: prepilin-type N-terminal cleavage/methylation domain-containing protein [Phycisphaeraceae bacterium]|nr:prepilin-type N-terminal cleavage/methylation domain-containing protein [Phycisphaeraceae bacterium]